MMRVKCLQLVLLWRHGILIYKRHFMTLLEYQFLFFFQIYFHKKILDTSKILTQYFYNRILYLNKLYVICLKL